MHIQVRGTQSAPGPLGTKKVYDVDIDSSSAIEERIQDLGVRDNGMMRIRRIMSWAL